MTQIPPLADRYLDELASLLRGAAPEDRADVLAAVREHIEQALADQAARGEQPDVARVLDELGAPEQVAAGVDHAASSAASSAGYPAGYPAGPGARTVPALAGTWVPPLASMLLLLGVGLGFLGVPLLMWLAATVLIAASPLWRTREKLIILIGTPVVGAVTLVGGLVSIRTVSATCATVGDGPRCRPGPPGLETFSLAAVWPAALLVVLALAAVVYVLVAWRRAARRAEELSGGVPLGDLVR